MKRSDVTVELRAAVAGAAVGMEEAAEAARVDALEAKLEEVMEAEQVVTAEAEVNMGAMQEGVNGGDGGSGGRDGGNDGGGGGGVWVCGA
jgi:hypothetical protein